ncbi:signal peptidase I [Pilimelia columellifera]|uniref:Signal peptidase I n=1 Tax=Pilimelia columellifera subsp. columellifera TaxID=706583 RepID=A0ABP6AGZ0_9ACTN
MRRAARRWAGAVARWRRPGRTVLSWTVTALAAASVVVAARVWVVEPLRVGSDSMSPTVDRGAVVLVEKLSPRWRQPARGELIAFCSPEDGQLILKRVAAVGGDVVEIRDGRLFVNDGPVDEPSLDAALDDGHYFGPVPVPTGAVFLLGDNRTNSIDSRDYGPVPLGEIEARVLLGAR